MSGRVDLGGSERTYGYGTKHAHGPRVESTPSGNGDIFNFQTEEKAQQDAPDAPEESAPSALSGNWLQEFDPRMKTTVCPTEGTAIIFLPGEDCSWCCPHYTRRERISHHGSGDISRVAKHASPTSIRCKALECGSLLPLCHQPTCWRGILHAFETPRASSLEGKRQQAAAL